MGCLHGLVCLYQLKLKSTQIKCAQPTVAYDPKSSFYDTSPEQRQHINSKNAHKQTSRCGSCECARDPLTGTCGRSTRAPVCSSSRTRDGTASPASPPPLGGGGGGRSQGRGVWGSPRAGPPMEKEGGVRSARSGEIRMQPADNVIRRTPCLLPVVVSPFVGARHVAHIAHAAIAGPRPAGLCTAGAWA